MVNWWQGLFLPLIVGIIVLITVFGFQNPVLSVALAGVLWWSLIGLWKPRLTLFVFLALLPFVDFLKRLQLAFTDPSSTVPNAVYLPNRLLFLVGFFNPGGSPATSLRAPWRDPHIRFFMKASLCGLLKGTGFVISEFKGDFSFANFPIIYRLRRIRRIADFLSMPLRPLGHYWPSVFAFRFFVVAKKPA
jgi:hypothetical protein